MKNAMKNLGLTVLALLAVVMIVMPGALAVPNTPPVIDSIFITPENPSKYNDLVCSVGVSDAEGNLDYVHFAWYLNGVLTKENNKVLYGSSSTASDVFAGSKEANDYVVCEAKAYDFESAYDRETHAVRVGTVNTISVPQISYVDITPRHPNPQQDLTCSVFATDADDNLDHVTFEWIVNGRMIRSAAKYMEGSSDVASDTLEVSRTQQGDMIRCKASVADASSMVATAESVTVVMGASTYPYNPTPTTPPVTPTYGKPVAVLKIYDNTVDVEDVVHFSGHDSYAPSGHYVDQYMFDYGDGQESSWQPDANGYHSYEEDGTYYVRLKVKDENGLESNWSPASIVYVGTGSGGGSSHISIDDMSIIKSAGSGYTRFECNVEVFDKSDDLDYVRFKWYLNDDLMSNDKVTLSGGSDEASDEISLLTDEEDVIKCEAIAYDQKHNSATATRTTGGSAVGEGCKLVVTKFDYLTYIMQSKNAYVDAEVQNTGSSGSITMKLYVDDSLKDTYSSHANYNAKVSKKFEFALATGSHKIKLDVYMPCGAKDTKTAEITVFAADSTGFIPKEKQESASDVTQTSVKITPAALDIAINKGDVVTVYIESPAQTKFTITVDGIPENWASYPAEVDVKGAKTAFVYIVPKAVGNYNFVVKVSGAGKNYEQNIALYAALESGAQNSASGLTGLISGLEGNWLIGAAFIAVLAVLAVLYFMAGRTKGKKYEDHVYGERRTPYYGQYSAQAQPRMMKGSVGVPVNAAPQAPRV
ncbi:MAG: PKD domain-containing protein, partial [Candidatus Aenigmatarchaeota archaeon]